MSSATTPSVVRQIGSLYDGGSVAGLTDRQLIERFNDRRDVAAEAAFTALVTRHAPMVLDVCRQILGDLHHAEDAFQAVFLVLARKARSIRDPDLLSNWLYGVALRTARKARARLARQRKNEEAAAMRRAGSGFCTRTEPVAQPAEEQVLNREQAEFLYHEIDRLPGPFRLPIVLCYFEGLTTDEAAHRLRCPAGTVRSRLARACDKLRHGLWRRGIVVPGATLTAVLSHRSASASISSALCDITTRSALEFAAGLTIRGAVSAPAAGLADEVLRSMLIRKLTVTLLTFVFIGAAASGVGYWNHSLATTDEPLKDPASQMPRLATGSLQPSDARTRPAAQPEPMPVGRMIVAGNVLDPAGNPVKDAAVDVVTRARDVWIGASEIDAHFTMLGQGATNGDGRFRLEVPRTSSRTSSSAGFLDLVAVASAPGFALGWAALNPDAQQPWAEVRLRPEQIVRIKLVDINGRPATGVEVLVQNMGQPSAMGEFDGVSFWPMPPKDLRAWPQPAKTDERGQLVLNGIGRALSVSLGVRDPRFARQDMRVEVGSRGDLEDKETTLALEPATTIEGRVLAADTGQPVPHAVIAVAASRGPLGSKVTFRYRADGKGRYTANPYPGQYFRVNAFAPEGHAYLVPRVEFAWTKGTVKKVLDIELPRGVVIRGIVTEENTGRPVEGARVQYIPVHKRDGLLSGWQSAVAGKKDGSYEIAVPSGKGHLLIFGPTPDYVLKEIGSRRLDQDQPGGQRYYAHDIIAYEAKAGDQPHDISAKLRPGVTIKGRVEGPDGQTVTDAFILTTLRIEPYNPFWRGDYQIHVRDGRFELHESSLARMRLRACISSTLCTSGARRSRFPASRPART